MAQLPFAERHPSVVDADGAIAQASHDEGAVGVTGQAGHAAVSTRGDILGPDTETSEALWCRATNSCWGPVEPQQRVLHPGGAWGTEPGPCPE